MGKKVVIDYRKSGAPALLDPLSITTGIITLYSVVWQLKKLKDSYTDDAPEITRSLERDCDEMLSIILHTKCRLDRPERHPTPDDTFNPVDIKEKLRENIATLHPEVKALKAELTTPLQSPETKYDHLKSLFAKARHVSHLENVHKKIGDRLGQFDRLLRSVDGESDVATLRTTESIISEEGTGILLHAITGGRRKDVKMILRVLGVDPNPKDAETGMYPLHVATVRNDLVMMEELLNCRAAPDAEDKRGQTALHIATRKDMEQAVEFLLHKKANPNAKDNEGADIVNHHCSDPHMPTALWAAAASSYLPTAQALLEAGASAKDASVGAKDNEGKLPLHRAAAVGKTSIVNALLKRMGDDGVNEADGEGATALIRGVQWGSAPDRSGNGAFYYACSYGHILVATYLLGQGAHIDERNKEGNTPLHVAAKWGRTEIVKLLLQLGADKKVRSCQKALGVEEGPTPADVARGAGHGGIAKMIDTFETDDEPVTWRVDVIEPRRTGS
ncbi:ankyrin repeat-containing domain protein [Rhexocercosporidium sp. MPI-PUGE-AT-0058]|nr:ankyrin repeat-containing domain protein [Rhexocercosporidium sp. MPI-PUGE-AT-0058]